MQENDPIHDEQLAAVEELVGRPLSPMEYEGFLIVSNRFVDRFGNSRIDNLAKVFDTHRIEGKKVLAASLEKVAGNLKSYENFAERYPVPVIPPRPAFPLFPIVGEHPSSGISNIGQPKSERAIDQGGQTIASQGVAR